jgi:hypothetical protein
MPAFNFKSQFVPLIESGKKRQTIRALRKDGRPHCRLGDFIKLYTGMRTKACRLIGESEVTGIFEVKVENAGIWVSGMRNFAPCETADQKVVRLDYAEAIRFARADGFANVGEMKNFFATTHGLPFKGILIRWKPLTTDH